MPTWPGCVVEKISEEYRALLPPWDRTVALHDTWTGSLLKNKCKKMYKKSVQSRKRNRKWILKPISHLVIESIGTVKDHALDGQGFGQVFSGLGFSGAGGTRRSAAQVQL